MTILEALRSGVSNYPFDDLSIEAIAVERGLSIGEEFTTAVATMRPYQLAKADCIRYVLSMVNLQQGGAAVSQTDIRTKIALANAIYRRYHEPLIADPDLHNATITVL